MAGTASGIANCISA